MHFSAIIFLVPYLHQFSTVVQFMHLFGGMWDDESSPVFSFFFNTKQFDCVPNKSLAFWVHQIDIIFTNCCLENNILILYCILVLYELEMLFMLELATMTSHKNLVLQVNNFTPFCIPENFDTSNYEIKFL